MWLAKKIRALFHMSILWMLLAAASMACSPASFSKPSETKEVGVTLKVVEFDTLAAFYFRDLSETGWLSGSVQAPGMLEMTFCCGEMHRAALLYHHGGNPRQVTIRAWNGLGEGLQAKWPVDTARTNQTVNPVQFVWLEGVSAIPVNEN
jgi:hypothetical protein